MPTDSQDTRPDNPAAFPVPPAIIATNGDMSFASLGMTLRDYFAAAVVPQAIEHEREIRGASINPSAFRYDLIAEAAYALADAMLAERAR